jgi:hypothetical protein
MFQFDGLNDLMTDAEFDAKPSALLIGQCAAGLPEPRGTRGGRGLPWPGDSIGF